MTACAWVGEAETDRVAEAGTDGVAEAGVGEAGTDGVAEAGVGEAGTDGVAETDDVGIRSSVLVIVTVCDGMHVCHSSKESMRSPSAE